jgi:hypothetical protein
MGRDNLKINPEFLEVARDLNPEHKPQPKKKTKVRKIKREV